MARQADNTASKRMYMGKVKAWDICKHYKAAEKEQLSTVIEDAKRRNLPLDRVTFRGQPVHVDRIEKYLKKKRRLLAEDKRSQLQCEPDLSLQSQQQSSESASGPDTDTMGTSSRSRTCQSLSTTSNSNASISPPQSRSASGATMSLPEDGGTLFAGRSGVQTVPYSLPPVTPFDAELLLKQIRAYATHTPHGLGEPPSCIRFWSSIRSAIYFLKVGSPHLAWPVLNAACANASDLLLADARTLSVPFLRSLLSTLAPANTRFHPEVRAVLLRYLSRRLATDPSMQPLSVICGHLAHDDSHHEASQRGLNLLLDLAQSPTRPVAYCAHQTLATHLALISLYRRVADLSAAETAAKLLIAHCDFAFGPSSLETCDAKVELVYIYTSQERYDEGLTLCQEVLDTRAQSPEVGEFPDKKACYAMENMAEMYHFRGQEGDVDMCIGWLKRALERTWRLRGSVPTTIHIRDKLWGMLVTLGRVLEAEDLEVRYPAAGSAAGDEGWVVVGEDS
ncbi:uncharacterized protein HMPREF1541_01082 [Cyphellophora europaea CBS 101466]|uniref:Clr5 domain-containing protein n=1 Tax=Cyphellophora europaea (strain CBS 101466) TaxID=1220924 RepID=W2SFX5_CYPE1|nr:uncharacterized protein HMPREF1541_01082 [Cyphellophora europaea CBS 101466]ETN46893.1 hypothetical protein HMPREF1541_01082 [Cyphellophora europaea CBS 101466]